MFNSLLLDFSHVEVTSCVVKIVLSCRTYLCDISTDKTSKHLKLFKQSFEAFTAFSNGTSNGKISIHPSHTVHNRDHRYNVMFDFATFRSIKP